MFIIVRLISVFLRCKVKLNMLLGQYKFALLITMIGKDIIISLLILDFL